MNRSAFLSTLFSIFIILCFCCPAHAAEDSAFQPDITIKVYRLDQVLKIIDDIVAADEDQAMSSPSFLLRSMLFGTEWIDVSRPIVIGINFKNMQPDQLPQMAALVPYKIPNEDFHLSYNAVSGVDHYIIALPPGQGDIGGLVPAQMENALTDASEEQTKGLITVELAASQMLKKADKQIQNMLLELDKNMAQQDSVSEFTAEDTKKLLESLINTAKQLNTLSLGLDISNSEMIIFSDAAALKGSDLSKVFVRGPASHTSRMGNYTPKHHISFKSASYNLPKMLDFFDKTFGEFYKKIGLDLASFEKIASSFSGEMAGGISFKDNGFDIEMIGVLMGKNGPEFLKSEYLPWLLDYGKSIAAIYNKNNPATPVKNIISKTKPSTVSGKKVYGIKCDLPLILPDSKVSDSFSFNLRMTAIDDMILTAASDAQLKKLIGIAKRLEKKDYDGPLMTMDFNIGAYMNAIQKIMPQMQDGMDIKFPDMGTVFYSFDMNVGTLSSKYIVKLDDIKSMASSFQDAAAAATNETYAAGNLYSQPQQSMSRPTKQRPKPKVKKEDTAEFWLDKGMLYATYGNDDEAIKFFKKALEIDPNNTSSLFNLGLSYSSLGQYDTAINYLQQAAALNPENGDYYYGLGWVYLLKGETGNAMKYIRTAADLGNLDAKNYLLRNP